MRVLVTGGAGFVGSHLVDRFIGEGHEVVVIDDLSTGDRRNLELHGGDARLRFIEARIEDPDAIEAAFDGVDLVFHLAAAVGVFEVLRRPLDALHRNIRGSEIVFERAARDRVPVVFTSTSEVYGKNDADALSENHDSIFGSTSVSRWLYAVSKAADEFLAMAYFRERDLPIVIVRLFNTTGPRQTGAYGMVVPRFVQQALAGDPLTVYGDGRQTRCFTNVYDVVEALTRLSRAPEAAGEVVNIGMAHEIAIADLADLVRSITGSTSPVELVDYAVAYMAGYEDMRRRVPDVSKLRRLTGFVPGTPIDETIRQIVNYVDPAHPAGREPSASFRNPSAEAR
jgi:UDP-glucose 4-epimerase